MENRKNPECQLPTESLKTSRGVPREPPPVRSCRAIKINTDVARVFHPIQGYTWCSQTHEPFVCDGTCLLVQVLSTKPHRLLVVCQRSEVSFDVLRCPWTLWPYAIIIIAVIRVHSNRLEPSRLEVFFGTRLGAVAWGTTGRLLTFATPNEFVTRSTNTGNFDFGCDRLYDVVLCVTLCDHTIETRWKIVETTPQTVPCFCTYFYDRDEKKKPTSS